MPCKSALTAADGARRGSLAGRLSLDLTRSHLGSLARSEDCLLVWTVLARVFLAMGNHRRVPLLLAASTLALVLGTRSTLAAPSPSPAESCPSTYDDPYFAFPHPPRHGHAFVPSDSGNPVHPLLQDIRLPEYPTNPVPARDRHQLYTPGRNNSFRTTEFRFQPGRRPVKDAKDGQGGVDKRDVVSSVDVPFPPSACALSCLGPSAETRS